MKYTVFVLIFMQILGTSVWAKAIISSDDESIKVNVKPSHKNAIFTQNNQGKFIVSIKSTYNTKETGQISYLLTTDVGGLVYADSNEVTVAQKGNYQKKITVPLPDPGFYNLTVVIELDDYEDTLKTVVGYRPFDIETPLYLPENFDEFWDKTLDQLKKTPPNYKIIPDSIDKTPTHHIYQVFMRSLDSVEISARVSIPRVIGKQITLLVFPGYKKLLPPYNLDGYAVVELNIRTRTAKDSFGLKELEFAQYHLENPYEYVYRGVYMDCIRAIDFIFDNAALGFDTTRVVVLGGSQGGALAFVTAALDQRVTCAITDNPVFGDVNNYLSIAKNIDPLPFPANHYIGFSEKMKLDLKDVVKTLNFFDPQNFASKIKCPILLGLGLLDNLAPPACVFSTFNKLPPEIKQKSEVYVFPNLGHEIPTIHISFKNVWIAENTVAKNKNMHP